MLKMDFLAHYAKLKRSVSTRISRLILKKKVFITGISREKMHFEENCSILS
jgi:hypothetical protein